MNLEDNGSTDSFFFSFFFPFLFESNDFFPIEVGKCVHAKIGGRKKGEEEEEVEEEEKEKEEDVERK